MSSFFDNVMFSVFGGGVIDPKLNMIVPSSVALATNIIGHLEDMTTSLERENKNGFEQGRQDTHKLFFTGTPNMQSWIGINGLYVTITGVLDPITRQYYPPITPTQYLVHFSNLNLPYKFEYVWSLTVKPA